MLLIRKYKGPSLFLFVFVVLLLTSTHESVYAQNDEPALEIISQEEALKRVKVFDYEPSDFKLLKREVVKSEDDYDLEEIEMQIEDPMGRYGSYTQHFTYYNVKGEGKKPVVIVSRPLKNRFVDRFVANSFAKLGYSSLLIIPPESLVDPGLSFDEYNEVMVRYVITMRVSIDMLEKFKEVDKDRIYAYGLSLGGMRTVLGFSVDKRIKKAAAVVAGGDFPGILTDSRYPVVMYRLYSRRKVEGVESTDELKKLLYEKMSVDPMHFAFLRDPEDILFVLGKNDQFVRDKYQIMLYEAFSRPEEGRYPGFIQSTHGHVFTVYSLRNHAEDFVKYIETGKVPEEKSSILDSLFK